MPTRKCFEIWVSETAFPCILRALLSKTYRFEIPFLAVYLVKKCFQTFRGGGGAWPHGPPTKYATVSRWCLYNFPALKEFLPTNTRKHRYHILWEKYFEQGVPGTNYTSNLNDVPKTERWKETTGQSLHFFYINAACCIGRVEIQIDSIV